MVKGQKQGGNANANQGKVRANRDDYPSTRSITEAALIEVGLPVKCRKCKKKGVVKPNNYGGWYKCKIFGRSPNKWFCPEHYDIANDMEDRFYQMSVTPEPEPSKEDEIEELYNLLD